MYTCIPTYIYNTRVPTRSLVPIYTATHKRGTRALVYRRRKGIRSRTDYREDGASQRGETVAGKNFFAFPIFTRDNVEARSANAFIIIVIGLRGIGIIAKKTIR